MHGVFSAQFTFFIIGVLQNHHRTPKKSPPDCVTNFVEQTQIGVCLIFAIDAPLWRKMQDTVHFYVHLTFCMKVSSEACEMNSEMCEAVHVWTDVLTGKQTEWRQREREHTTQETSRSEYVVLTFPDPTSPSFSCLCSIPTSLPTNTHWRHHPTLTHY